jgi:hypothetical protein
LAIFSLILAFFAGLLELNRGYWSLALVLPALPSFLMCIVLSRCPESPKFLYMSCGKREQAQQVLNLFFDKKQATSMFVSLIKENSQTKVTSLVEVMVLIFLNYLDHFKKQFLGTTNQAAKIIVCTTRFSMQTLRRFTDYFGSDDDRHFHCFFLFHAHT